MTEPLRSLLFVPGDDERKMSRAIESGADVVIFDLEDSVAVSRKSHARETLLSFLANARPKRFAVRVNGDETAEHLDDLVTVARVSPTYVMLPKCSGAADLARLDARLDVLERINGIHHGKIGLLPLVSETAAALSGLDYRGVTTRLRALVFAGEDLSADLGVTARPSAGQMNALLSTARQLVAIASAQAGVPAIDTPFPDPKDMDGLRLEINAAAELGYAGKLCIHPSQIEPVHDGMRPSAEKLLWAEAVVAAFSDAPASGVTTVNGKMVDKAHLRLALKIQTLGGSHG